jgi:hypothetical protein
MVTTCEVWMIVDAAGDYAVGTDADAAKERYAEDVGELAEAEGFRLVKVSLTVPLPKVLEMAGTAPEEEPGTLAATVA